MTKLIAAGVLASGLALAAEMNQNETGKANPPAVKLTVEPGHPWIPPFGLERVGRPLEAVVEIPSGIQAGDRYTLVSYRNGQEIIRKTVPFPPQEPRKPIKFGRVTLEEEPAEVALLFTTQAQPTNVEVARTKVPPLAEIEAEAVARPEKVVNPVDLGVILPPADWLLLSGGQKGSIEVAALARRADFTGAKIVACYQSAPGQNVSTSLPLPLGIKSRTNLPLPLCPENRDHDVLLITIVANEGRTLWQKAIEVMIVSQPPTWPAFGAVETTLRYDRPIRAVAKGKISWIDYGKAWDPALQDLVVFFPNGARWVFWRGASYCPFWATTANIGVNYQWAERGPAKDGFSWCEPLFDNELRYGRVEIVESTAARVHVRWKYQLSNFKQQASPDSAVENFYFYPDGLGTRMMTLTRTPGLWYQMEEYVMLLPQSAYPWESVPQISALSLGSHQRLAIEMPFVQKSLRGELLKLGAQPWIFRIQPPGERAQAAICLVGSDNPIVYRPCFHRGAMASPTYWGNQWPLNRGLDTVWGIADVDAPKAAPASISTVSWMKEPKPLRSHVTEQTASSGKVEKMEVGTYVWLIGMTAAGDDELRYMAQSFSKPPRVEIKGATLADGSYYAQERRALCAKADAGAKAIEMKIIPTGWCVNPVFEIENAPRELKRVCLDGRELHPKRYAWDGKILWIEAGFDKPVEVQLEF